MNAIRFRATMLTVLLGATAAVLMPAAVFVPAGTCHAAVSGAVGRVFEVDQNGRLVRPVPNAAIEIRNLAQQPVASAVSDPNGYYQVQLPPGQYRYKVQAAGFRVENHGRGFIVERPDRYDLVDLTLTRAAGPPDPQPWIPDITPDPQPQPDITPQPHPDPHPQPEPDWIVTAGDLSGQVYWMHGDRREGIPGAQITLRRVGERGRGVPAQSGLDGRYQTQLAVGAWRATVNARGFQQRMDPNDIDITGGAVTRDFELKPIEEPTPEGQGIEGYVRVMSDSHRHRTLDPQALPPADPPGDLSIFIYRRGTRTRIGPVPHDSHGDYRQALEPADYQVEARAEGFKTKRSDWTTVFAGRFERVNLVLEPEPTGGHQAVLDVTVVDHQSQQPLAGIEFQVRARQPGQALTEAVAGKTIEGVAHLAPLDLAKYEVFALPAEGYELVEKKELDIQAGANRLTLPMRKHEGPINGPSPGDLAPVGLFGYVTWKDATSQTGYRGVQGVTLHWEWITQPKSKHIGYSINVTPNNPPNDQEDQVEPLEPHFAGWWTAQMGAGKDYRLHVSVDLAAATATGTYKASVNTVGVLRGTLSDGGRRWEGHWTEGKASEENPTMPVGEPGGRFRAVMAADNTDAFSGCYNHGADKPLKDCVNYGHSQIRGTRIDPPEGGKFSVTTDAQGRFPLGGKVVTAPSGWYRVTFAEIPGDFLPKGPATVLVDAEHVQQYFILEKKPDERITVRGTVSDARTRRLLDGATVTWYVQQRDGGIAQYTAEAPGGQYAIALAPGNYRARAERAGYKPTDRVIPIQTGKRNTEDFALEPLPHPTPHPQPVPDHAVSLVIDVLGADPHGLAAPLSGVRVDVAYQGRVRAWGHTDARGQWAESLPPADRLDVKLSKPGYQTQTDSFPLQGRGVRKRYVMQPEHAPHPHPQPDPHPHPQPHPQPQPHPEPHPHPDPSGNHPVTLRITHGRGMAIFAQVEIKRGGEVVAKGGAKDGTFQTQLPNAAYTVAVRWRGLTATDAFTVRDGPVTRTIELHGKPTGYISPAPRGR